MPLTEEQKQRKRDYDKQYREKNKEKLNKQKRENYYKNRDKKLAYQSEYNKNNPHITLRCLWRKRGIICDDWDALYERYINTEYCELCNVKLTDGKIRSNTTRCLDHDHTTGEIRNVVCNSCNIKRG